MKLVLALTLTAACGKDSAPQAAEKANEAAAKAGEMAAKAQAEADQLADKAAAKAGEASAKTDVALEQLKKERDEFMAASAERLRDLDGKIASLEAKTKAGADKTAEAALAKLKAMRAEVDVAYQRSTTATGNTWADMKRAYEEAYAKAAAEADQAAAK